MRLAVVSSHPIQYYAPLFRELARQIDVHVFFAHRATPQQQADAGFGTPFDWDLDLTEGYSHSFLTNVSRNPGTGHFGGCDTPEIGKRLREYRPDALLVFGWHLKSAIQATVAAKAMRTPVIVRGDSQLSTPRSWLKRTVKRAAYPLFLRLFDAALTVGARSRDYYRHYGYPENCLFNSPHCVDTSWFAARATPESARDLRQRLNVSQGIKLLLFAGKFVSFKRPLDVVETGARLRAQGLPVELLFAGSGVLGPAIAARATALQVPLHDLGFQNQTAMPAAYAAADLLMLPSDGAETWGLVSNEALACGTPILVSDACGCAEDLAGDASAGRRFRLGDIDAAATDAAMLLTAPPSAGAIAAKSGQFSVEAAVSGVIEAVSYLTGDRLGQAREASDRLKNAIHP